MIQMMRTFGEDCRQWRGKTQPITTYHFTVVCLVAWPLNESETGGVWLTKWCKIHKVYTRSHSMLHPPFTNISIHIQQPSPHSRNTSTRIHGCTHSHSTAHTRSHSQSKHWPNTAQHPFNTLAHPPRTSLGPSSQPALPFSSHFKPTETFNIRIILPATHQGSVKALSKAKL